MELRWQAVRLVEAGLGVTEVGRRLGRSRRWVHKWLRRFRADGEAGLTDRSRAPKTTLPTIDAMTVAEVLRIRGKLEDDPVASVGAESIQATMERGGWKPIPSVASIERILSREGRTRPYRHKIRSENKLPLPVVTRPGVWQQADWVQDRYLEGGIRFQSLQATDVGSGAIASQQYSTRTALNAVTFLVQEAWPVLSIPYAMGTDNAFVKTTHPHNPFTLWTRLCLFFGVEVLIAPPGGLGWTNHVEAVNNLWQARTIRARRFYSIDELRVGSQQACHWLNHYRPLHNPTRHGTRYPIEVIAHHADTLRWLPPITLTDHQDRTGKIHIPLAAGRITYIRHASQHRTIEIANITWPLPDHIPIGALITATITTHTHTLTLRHQAHPIATYPYPIKHPITDPYYPPAEHGLLDTIRTTPPGP